VIENLNAWLRGAARKVLQEAGLEQRREADSAINAIRAREPSHATAETDHLLLEECLARLSAESRSLVEQYYHPRQVSLLEARRRLSVQLGISSENLRTRAMRVRKQLEECLRNRRGKAGE